MNEMIMDALTANQDICPACGVFWPRIKDILEGLLTSEDKETALLIVANCKVCQGKFRKELRRINE